MKLAWCMGLFLCLLPAALSSCAPMMNRTQPAIYDLPKDKRVLVFVDERPGIESPAGYSSELADKISDQLFAYHVLEKVVPQARLMELRKDPEKFGKLHVADIARETNADVVVYVDLYKLDMNGTGDQSITQGAAQVLVKVIDSNGKRMWPVNNVAGEPVSATVDAEFADQRNTAAVAKQLSDKLAREVGRIFHPYLTNESTMGK